MFDLAPFATLDDEVVFNFSESFDDLFETLAPACHEESDFSPSMLLELSKHSMFS